MRQKNRDSAPVSLGYNVKRRAFRRVVLAQNAEAVNGGNLVLPLVPFAQVAPIPRLMPQKELMRQLAGVSNGHLSVGSDER